MILFETIQFTIYGHIVYIHRVFWLFEDRLCLRTLFIVKKKTWPEKSTIHCVVSILYEDKILSDHNLIKNRWADFAVVLLVAS